MPGIKVKLVLRCRNNKNNGFFRLTEDSWEEKKKRALTEVEWLKWSRPCRGIDILCPGHALNCMSMLYDKTEILYFIKTIMLLFAYEHPCHTQAPPSYLLFSVQHWKAGNRPVDEPMVPKLLASLASQTLNSSVFSSFRINKRKELVNTVECEGLAWRTNYWCLT